MSYFDMDPVVMWLLCSVAIAQIVPSRWSASKSAGSIGHIIFSLISGALLLGVILAALASLVPGG
jgi:hypothetical protein